LHPRRSLELPQAPPATKRIEANIVIRHRRRGPPSTSDVGVQPEPFIEAAPYFDRATRSRIVRLVTRTVPKRAFFSALGLELSTPTDIYGKR
jgi:hypothetical protein